MSNEAAEFQNAVDAIERSYRQGLRAFAEWFAKEWQLTPEGWRKAFADPVPSEDWFDGYNAGVESARTALDTFIDEHMNH
jgi:hypothetical protein